MNIVLAGGSGRSLPVITGRTETDFIVYAREGDMARVLNARWFVHLLYFIVMLSSLTSGSCRGGGGGSAAIVISAPIANAGADQYVFTGSLVSLDGSSSAASSSRLTYSWSFVAKPVGSTSTFSNPKIVSPSFVPDKDGIYTVNLIVHDERSNKEAVDAVTITASTEPIATGKIPDTGQTHDYSLIFGEDSDYSINPPSYSDNGNGTVTDNVTGLLWQKDDDATKRNWSDAKSYCETLRLAGFVGWRLPTDKELQTLVDYDTYAPAININYFPSTKSSYYWTSNLNAYYASNQITTHWYVYFGGGQVNADPYEPTDTYVRCVLGSQLAQVFVDNADGTITDNVTGLMWQQAGGQNVLSWDGSISYCEDLSLAGYTDWRLPNVKELKSITDSTLFFQAINSNYFQNTQDYYWSSTGFAYYQPFAWYVNFQDGFVYDDDRSLVANARCVRGGQ